MWYPVRKYQYLYKHQHRASKSLGEEELNAARTGSVCEAHSPADQLSCWALSAQSSQEKPPMVVLCDTAQVARVVIPPWSFLVLLLLAELV